MKTPNVIGRALPGLFMTDAVGLQLHMTKPAMSARQ
jgi:hypothetical protein